MSETLLTLQSTFVRRNDDDDFLPELDVTAFHGGRDNGSAIQLTLGDKYISLVDHDVKSLVDTLQDWLETRRRSESRPVKSGRVPAEFPRLEANLYVCSHCFSVRANPLIHYCPVCKRERDLFPLAIDFGKRIFVIVDTRERPDR